MINLNMGQVNGVLFGLLVVCYFAYGLNKPVIAGIALSMLIALKVFPGLLLLFFIFKKQYRILVVCGIGLLFFTMTPFIYFGIEHTLLLYQDWWIMLQSKVLSISHHAKSIGVYSLLIKGLNHYLSDSVLLGMAYIISFVLLLMTLVILFRQERGIFGFLAKSLQSLLRRFIYRNVGKKQSNKPKNPRPGEDPGIQLSESEIDYAQYSCLVIVSLLIAPASWYFYLLFLGMPCMGVVMALIKQPSNNRRLFVWFGLFILCLLFLTDVVGPIRYIIYMLGVQSYAGFILLFLYLKIIRQDAKY